MKLLRERLRRFFVPPSESPWWVFVLPYAAIILLGVIVFGGGIGAWEYTNSSEFCGTACHTMPPEATVYKLSPHSNITCEECHIGRASFFSQVTRKSSGLLEMYSQAFKLYKYPIHSDTLRPSVETCERCHRPDTFSDDSLRTKVHYGDGVSNPQTKIYMLMKTGGGSKREGLGKGIHWHVENPVYFYASDPLSQEIPYIRVDNTDGSTTEYVDIESGFNVANLDESQLKRMDCITCHNRITHNFKNPADSVDESMARGTISADIPEIHQRAVAVLTTPYQTQAEAMQAIDAVGAYYKTAPYYPGHEDQVQAAIDEVRSIYDRTVFLEQKVDWNTHPNNLGHMESPGCFRCHDGKHLNGQDKAIRLECNLCHAIPTVAHEEDFVSRLEIAGRIEPESHLNPNWINLHNRSFNYTCANCHTIQDLGGTSNTSFCSNSACHGNVFTFAGFDAPKLREILKAQIPTPPPTPPAPPIPARPSFDNYIGRLLGVRCTACHGDSPSAGLSFLTYSSTMNGSAKGPVIVPGDSTNSLLVIIQSRDHFARLTPEQLALIVQWIDSGAPEK